MSNLIRLAIERPIAVLAAVLMVLMFGLVALQSIPIQLAPDVSEPVITVETSWPGAAPAEVEREILNRQEEVMGGLEGLTEMTGSAETGRSRLTLEFLVGTSMDKALLLVANRLDRVGNYPDEVDEPTLETSGSEDSPIAWFVVTRQDGNTRPIATYGDFIEDVVQDRIERVPGVAKVNVFGGSERRLEVIVQPQLLTRYNLTVSQVAQTLRAGNASISAGDVEEGKRRYVVRTEGELDAIGSVQDVVLRSFVEPETGRVSRVTVADLAEVDFGYDEPRARIRILGSNAIAFNAVRETGANVIETMRGIREAVRELNDFAVPNAGLHLRQVYDETVYINSAIDLVNQNIFIGGALAAIVLLIFLRSVRATLVVSLAIPVSVIGAFVAMAALGRSINVISLAGLAFAIGMVVDAAIVVLENIYRLRERGYPISRAAYHGAAQVWGAILVSALTTVMVFIPILTMELEVGQLFRDIAVAISVAVVLSLIVSVTVIPALARQLFGFGGREQQAASVTRLPIPGIDHFARGFVALIMGIQRRLVRSKIASVLVVAAVTTTAGVGAWQALPKLEYLPEGNRNLVLGVLIPPPGYNLDTTFEIARRIESEVKPLWRTDDVANLEETPEGELKVMDRPAPLSRMLTQLFGGDAERGPPLIERFFFVATPSRTFVGAIATEPERVSELIPILEGPVFREPGTFGFINQPSIFGRSIGGGRKVELDISGRDLEDVVGVAQRAAGIIARILPLSEGNQLRPNPGLELGAPEMRIFPNRMRLADNGVSTRELAETIDAFNDGLLVDEVTVGTKRLDLVLKGLENNVESTQGIGDLPVVTRTGQILPANLLADIKLTAGPTEIRHRERFRTITLEVRPKPQLPLESAVDMLRSDVIDKLNAEGLPPGVKLGISGTADKLTQTWNAMVVDLLLAIVIVFLVMAVLFESFVYPLIIMLAVPLAAAGGVAGLALLNEYTYQPLDMLTLLGFVILVGIVVNNAILLVHQTLYLTREEEMIPREAILEATRNRIRPIFMSTLTSVFGMLPLVLFPGAGSELYKGLGSVVVGGLALSAVLTLLVVPPMMAMLLEPLERWSQRRRAADKKVEEEIAGKSGKRPEPAAGE